MTRSTTSASLLLVTGLLAFTSGCEKAASKPQPAATGGTATQASNGTTNWSSVKAVDANAAMDALCALCRTADVSYGGAHKTLTLTFANGAATDDKGTTYKVTAAEWKGIVAMIDKSPNKTGAARAMPAAAKNYGDGKGPTKRNAYEVKTSGEDTLILNFVKALDDNSAG